LALLIVIHGIIAISESTGSEDGVFYIGIFDLLGVITGSLIPAFISWIVNEIFRNRSKNII
jgi:hypothetical protein